MFIVAFWYVLGSTGGRGALTAGNIGVLVAAGASFGGNDGVVFVGISSSGKGTFFIVEGDFICGLGSVEVPEDMSWKYLENSCSSFMCSHAGGNCTSLKDNGEMLFSGPAIVSRTFSMNVWVPKLMIDVIPIRYTPIA